MDLPTTATASKLHFFQASAYLYRVHDERFGGNDFNRCEGNATRFTHLFDEHGGCIPTSYAATTGADSNVYIVVLINFLPNSVMCDSLVVIREFLKRDRNYQIFFIGFCGNDSFGVFAKVFAENVKSPQMRNFTSRPCQALCDLVGCFGTKKRPIAGGYGWKGT